MTSPYVFLYIVIMTAVTMVVISFNFPIGLLLAIFVFLSVAYLGHRHNPDSWHNLTRSEKETAKRRKHERQMFWKYINEQAEKDRLAKEQKKSDKS